MGSDTTTEHEAGTPSATVETPSRQCLASLHPLPVAPPDFSARTRILLSLHQIDFISVVPPVNPTGRRRESLYRIHVYFKSSENHISLSKNPTNTTQFQHQRQRRPPDVVVDRSFPELMKLRDDLFQLARGGHSLEPCAICLRVIIHCGYGNAKPHWSMTWLHSKENVCAKLTMFMNDTLELVVKVKAFANDQCIGQARIPVLLHRFLGLSLASDLTA